MLVIKKTYGLIFLSILFGNLSAQTNSNTCTQDDLLGKIGTWIKINDYIQPGKNYLQEMKTGIFNRLERLRQLISKAYTAKGMEVRYERQIYGTAPYKSGTVTYGLWGQLLEYGCDARTNKLVLADESNDHFYVFVNHFDRFVVYDTSMHIGHLYVALMPNRSGTIKGTDLFQTSLARMNERFIIVSRNGQLPYMPLTRKQYLQALKERLQRQENHFINRDAQYLKDEAKRKSNEQYWKSHIDPEIKKIDDYLSTRSETDLSQTAFVKDMQGFTTFYSEKEGGRMPVILNSSYFNPNQTPYFPQFIMIYWQWNDGEGPGGGILRPVAPDMNVCCKVANYYKKSMEQNLDVEAFRQMLDK